MDETKNVNQVSANTPPQKIEVEPVQTEGSIPISEVQAIPVQPVTQVEPKTPTSAQTATSVARHTNKAARQFEPPLCY